MLTSSTLVFYIDYKFTEEEMNRKQRREQAKQKAEEDRILRKEEEYDRIRDIFDAWKDAEENPEEGWIVPMSRKDKKLLKKYAPIFQREEEEWDKEYEEHERKMREDEENEEREYLEMLEEQEEEKSNAALIYHRLHPEDREMDGFDNWFGEEFCLPW